MVDPALLHSLPIFTDLPPHTLEKLASRSVELCLDPNEVLYVAGTEPTALLLVVAGRVRVVRAHRGRQFLIHEEGPGGALGEVPLFAGGSYPATAIAVEPTRCIRVSMEAIRSAVQEDPDLAFIFLKRLALRVRGVVGQLDRLAVQSIETRLAQYLISRQDALGKAQPFALGRTQTIVAEELGTVREVLVRALKRFRDLGIIEAKGRGYYRIVDDEQLRQMLAP